MSDMFLDFRRKALKERLQQLFHEDKKHHEDRKGLHGSDLIKSDEKWCYRKAILSLNFPAQDVKHSESLLRIFKHGNIIHDKWQNMFKSSGIADFIEARCFSEMWELLSTPDAIVTIDNKQYVVEIKSMNSMSYRTAVKGAGHPSGKKQCILYMYLFGIPNGFILMENKDTQEYELQMVEFDLVAFKTIETVLDRLFWSKSYNLQYRKDKTLPIKKCKKNNEPCAKECAYSNVCFNLGG